MPIETKQIIGGGILSFVLATSCCWLPMLIISLGGAGSLLALSSQLEAISGPLMAIGLGLFVFGGYQLYNRNKMQTIIAVSTIKCPKCGHEKEETMPTDACQFFYECESCKTILKPKAGDCCVYCSYGTVPCPPIQEGGKESCCS